MDKKDLEILLSRAPRFPKPKRELEQYVTDSRTASMLLWHSYMNGDIVGKKVLDLGCGTGVFAIGALVLGAEEALCVDIDCDALLKAVEWSKELQVYGRLHIVCSNVITLNIRPSFDTVVMNPPFGVYKRGADIEFLTKAMDLRVPRIYSIHKFNPESHRLIVETASKHGYRAQLLAVQDMMIPQIFETHRRRVYRFKVGLYIFTYV